MSFSEQSFGGRFGKMGDEAEGMFEEASPLGGWSRYGWNRNAQFRYMDPFVANTPDYFCNSGELVEVMGMNGDEFKAMKLTKWESLKQWHARNRKAGGLYYFIWNRKFSTWVLIPHREMVKMTKRSLAENRIGTFEVDGNQYYGIPWAWLLTASKTKGGAHGTA